METSLRLNLWLTEKRKNNFVNEIAGGIFAGDKWRTSLKIVYMGTPDFAVAPMLAIAKEHEVLAVFTQPDRESGRGRKIQKSEVKVAAETLGCPIYQPDRLRDQENVDILKELNPDLIVVAAYGQILSEEILNIPKNGCINIHASILPKYRGASPIEASILNGDEETGVTIMYMAKGLDTGDIISIATTEIRDEDNTETLTARLSTMGAELVVKTIPTLEDGTASRTLQKDEESCYAGKLTKEMGRVDFNDSARMVNRKIHAFYPWPCAVTSLREKTCKLLDARALDEKKVSAMLTDLGISDVKPGQAFAITKKKFFIRCKEGALEILKLQPESKKPMDTVAFLNGFHLEAGEEFGK